MQPIISALVIMIIIRQLLTSLLDTVSDRAVLNVDRFALTRHVSWNTAKILVVIPRGRHNKCTEEQCTREYPTHTHPASARARALARRADGRPILRGVRYNRSGAAARALAPASARVLRRLSACASTSDSDAVWSAAFAQHFSETSSPIAGRP